MASDQNTSPVGTNRGPGEEDEEFDGFLDKIAEIQEDRQLPTLVSGYNPEKLADMSALFEESDRFAEEVGEAEVPDQAASDEPEKQFSEGS